MDIDKRVAELRAALASSSPISALAAISAMSAATAAGRIDAAACRAHPEMGAAVNAARRAGLSEEVRAAATALLLRWKELITAGKGGGGGAGETPESATAKSGHEATLVPETNLEGGDPKQDSQSAERNAEHIDAADSEPVEKPAASQNNTDEESEPAKAGEKRSLQKYAKAAEEKRSHTEETADVTQFMDTKDETRVRAAGMILSALSVEGSLPDANAASVAAAVEAALWALHAKSSAAEYRAALRSKYLNLKDKTHGGHLRRALLSGRLEPARLAAMAPAEMASAERQAADREMRERSLRESRAAQDNEAETDQFRCGRCQQRRTKYYQLQTRSADEPMTTFVTCINCGNRWKFC